MKRRLAVGCFAALGMLLLIMDAKTALAGAAEGLSLCFRSVVPSLLPFFFLSILLTGSLAGAKLPLLTPLGHLCGIPAGGEALLITGLLGGYPTGAQSIAQAYEAGALTKADARRMLGFCNNAGPAFLFGIVGPMLPKGIWLLWGIHIVSALLVGILLPGRSQSTSACKPVPCPTASVALQRSLRITASVCGWVVLFRVVIHILNRWLLWLFPTELQVILTGLLELTNGCCDLSRISGTAERFVTASLLLSVGGLCVLMQTVSVTKNLGFGMYFPGKCLQMLLSIGLSSLVASWLFPDEPCVFSPILPLTLTAIIAFFLHLSEKRKKTVAFPHPLVYNPNI